MKDSYVTYEKALKTLDLGNLTDRKEQLCLNVVEKCLKNGKMKHLFPKNNKIHPMMTRNEE